MRSVVKLKMHSCAFMGRLKVRPYSLQEQRSTPFVSASAYRSTRSGVFHDQSALQLAVCAD